MPAQDVVQGDVQVLPGEGHGGEAAVQQPLSNAEQAPLHDVAVPGPRPAVGHCPEDGDPLTPRGDGLKELRHVDGQIGREEGYPLYVLNPVQEIRQDGRRLLFPAGPAGYLRRAEPGALRRGQVELDITPRLAIARPIKAGDARPLHAGKRRVDALKKPLRVVLHEARQ